MRAILAAVCVVASVTSCGGAPGNSVVTVREFDTVTVDIERPQQLDIVMDDVVIDDETPYQRCMDMGGRLTMVSHVDVVCVDVDY